MPNPPPPTVSQMLKGPSWFPFRWSVRQRHQHITGYFSNIGTSLCTCHSKKF
ncbi:hypothetical protein FQN60_006525 [Etheostoma spectabile]|uniref:Uncharacterized protein n=1 Tax=Etheostoma spectabile TaxID=54343 RepID=A0A5J5CCF5_9PERO|nr:hypothetical protein FQN60_006525 [Etheostoma spectabile]